jgi:DNA-binding MarR family transcriptional regulator
VGRAVEAEDPTGGYSAMDVATAVRRLDLSMAQMHLELSERMGLSAAEVLALAHLSLEGSLGPTDLVRRLHITTGAMTALLDRLARRDFVTREAHPTDRRRVVVRLTASGRDRLFGNVHGMAGELVEVTELLTQEERRLIGRFLDEVSRVIAKPANGQSRTLVTKP